MKTIWKFPFTIVDVFTIEMPANAQLLHADVQAGVPCLWALVDPEGSRAKRRFRLYGTGHPVEPHYEALGIPEKHVATFQQPVYGNHEGVQGTNSPSLVWHLFDHGYEL